MDISEQDWYEVDRWFRGGTWRTCNLTMLRRQLERISPRPGHQNPPFLAKYDLLVGVLQERSGLLEEREAVKRERGSHSHAVLVGVALLSMLLGVVLGVWGGPYLRQTWLHDAGNPGLAPALGNKAATATVPGRP